jgi:uncharacterized DUF497 family protein
MESLDFTWDPAKNKANFEKHRVTFEEAKIAFYDDTAKVYDDPDHSEDENRFILLGRVSENRVLVVCHCFRESDTVIRIISARKADKKEQNDYWS